MKEPSLLFFIAIMLPQTVDAEVIAFKNEMAYRFQSRKALRTASHITLKAPFKVAPAIHQELLRWFEGMTITTIPFMQEIKDFGSFSNKRNPVIYVQPFMNEFLRHLQKEVLQQFSLAFPKEAISKNEYTFSPHITIAYRDLHYQQFKEAWQEYQTKTYTALFEVDSFQLLQHKDGRWQVVASYLLNHRDIGGTVEHNVSNA
jgi:2'-5' RNA ligase